jgi:hypothetical protein
MERWDMAALRAKAKDNPFFANQKSGSANTREKLASSPLMTVPTTKLGTTSSSTSATEYFDAGNNLRDAEARIAKASQAFGALKHCLFKSKARCGIEIRNAHPPPVAAKQYSV